ncbi:hypothetical protein EW146_g4872 [Bondarzewia mesenterica]|uniref:Uncharacterized protein n=1 Tax=Bondarzewia mesenterica TaxID=1095465 RepID=A0A4S4LT83_9AGAM|nr:hypothetical protein EW146_g4872 [Bondarzewia mesenterica]
MSSSRSVATLPVQPLSQITPATRSNHDRNRTLSTISSSSSSAALSSLAQLPTGTRSTHPHLTTHFPPAKPSSTLESFHPLLPSPYVPTHLTLLTYRNPIRESYDKVLRAKHRKRDG